MHMYMYMHIYIHIHEYIYKVCICIDASSPYSEFYEQNELWTEAPTTPCPVLSGSKFWEDMNCWPLVSTTLRHKDVQGLHTRVSEF